MLRKLLFPYEEVLWDTYQLFWQHLFKAAAEKLPTCRYKLERKVMMAISSETTVFACVVITDDLRGSAVCVLKCFYLLLLLGALSWAARGVHRVCGASRGCHHRNVQLPPPHQVQRVCCQREYFWKSDRWPSRSDAMRERFPHSLK